MPNWEETVEQRHTTSFDGTPITYEVAGEGKRAVLLANGLGGRLYVWEPLIADLWHDYKLLTWDYRGLFDLSDVDAGKLSLHHHVQDALAILRAEKIERVVLVGWSMGVQVSLDLAAHEPDLIAGLVLLNGTYGHVLQTGFQPFFAIPFLPKRLHSVIEFLRDRPEITKVLTKLARFTELPTVALMSITAGPKNALTVRPLLRRYFDEVLGPSFPNYLRLFQELDAHSVYHLLPDITAPALIVSGWLDMLTPAFQSFEIARRLPNAEHLALKRASHFALRERPEIVVPRVRTFLEKRARWAESASE
ncbi:MAG: alpha/beta hydrolase [Polyangiaceae bacterium]